MEKYQSLKNEILTINTALVQLFSQADAIPGMDGQSFEIWQNTCDTIRDQIIEEMIRVAVVGAIKSGKSTFTNALFKGDYLKRGAGVVTSIVTKARTGKQRKATLFLKSWDEVNSEMQAAQVFFPSFSHIDKAHPFDIRKQEDRTRLSQALAELASEFLIKDGSLNANTVLLSCYLKGYDDVSNLVSSENRQLVFEDGDFKKHVEFVGDDSRSVYLKDIQLQIDSNGLADNIEIADCQGSDSPNPLHLAMIQDYLALTHLIVYVISSRTGLRQADIKFLSMIKKMGILDNILFVVNTDFSEHENLDDLKALANRVREELSAIRPDPKTYVFSVLFNLFNAQEDHLSKKDSQRLAQWEGQAELTEFSRQETQRFQTDFIGTLTGKRSRLLLKNHLERLSIISSGVVHRIALNRDILSGDVQGAMAITERIKGHQDQIDRVKSLINTSLTGALLKGKQVLRLDIDRFFANRSGEIVGDTLAFIRNYNVPYQQFEEYLKTTGFTHTLYLVFQAFRQALDVFVAENVNPAIIRFIKDEEDKIVENLVGAVNPYHVMVHNVLAGYDGMMKGIERKHDTDDSNLTDTPDLDAIKNILGLPLPPMATALNYSARIKTDATLRLGFYATLGFVKRLFRKTVKTQKAEKILALQDGVKRMKRETEKAVVFHFKNYRENLKFQYVFKLADAVSSTVYETLVARFQTYATDLTSLIGLLDEQGGEKDSAMATLEDMAQKAGLLEDRIDQAREKIESTGA